jgi:hypothetical protein
MMPELSLGPSMLPANYDQLFYGENGRSIFKYTPPQKNEKEEKRLYKGHSKQLKIRRLSALTTNDEKSITANVPIVITRQMMLKFHPRVIMRLAEHEKKQVKFLFDY